MFNDFIQLDESNPSRAYEDDLGEHDINETRRDRVNTVKHPDRRFFEQLRTRYFNSIPIGQLVIDRLIRLIGEGYDMRFLIVSLFIYSLMNSLKKLLIQKKKDLCLNSLIICPMSQLSPDS